MLVLGPNLGRLNVLLCRALRLLPECAWRPWPARMPTKIRLRTCRSLRYGLDSLWDRVDHVRGEAALIGTKAHARRRRNKETTKTTGIDVGREEGGRAVSQARCDSLYHLTSLAMPSEKGVLGS